MLSDSFPFVSIIIPCRNEEKFIGNCMDSVLANDYPKDKIEVLVVDGMSEDKSKEILGGYSRQYEFIKVIDNPRKITPCAFNTGIRNSNGEIIMILGSHSTYQKDYISKCVQYLKEFEADNVGGIIVTLPREDTFMGKAVTAALSSRFGVGGSSFRTGVKEPTWVDTVFGGCYKKNVFDRVGFFNENLVSTQDMEFNLRLKRTGGKILLAPDIVSYYYTRSDLMSFCKNNFRNGFWAIYPFKFTTAMPVSWRHLVPLTFVLGLIGSGLLSAVVTHFFLLFLLILGSYVLTNLSVSFQIASQKRDIRYLIVIAFIFACLHFGYGLGSLAGGLGVLCSARFWKRFLGHKITKADVKKKDSWNLLKRAFDFSSSLIGLILVSPVLLTIAILIKKEDGEAVFYRGVRVGRFGKLFRVFKFRTMVLNAEKLGGPSTADDDPRITKMGRFVRKFKLDELPQLINVLKGEMSIVGPRPEVQMYVDMFTEEERAILSVRPGITDWASIWNPDEGAILVGSPDPEKTYMEKIRPEKIRLQLKYVRERSFWNDLKIIAQTLITIVR